MASDGGRKQFWKRSGAKVPGSIQHVYGAQHPPFDPLLHGTLIKPGSKPPATPVKLKKVSTFQEFESNTSDAWDLGDDDDELLAIAAENLNTEVVMETAHKVIQNHSKLQEQHKFQEEHPQEEKQVESAELTSVPCGDNRLVKSVSEGHTSSSSDNASENSSMQRSQSLPQTSTSPLVSGMADYSTSVTPALTEREASRLDKFKQLLVGPNTDLGNNGQDVLPCFFPAKAQKRVLPCIYNIGLDFILCFLHAFKITLCSIEKIKGSVCLKKKKLMKCLTELLFILETSCCCCHSNNKPSIKAIFYTYCLYCNMLLGELQFHDSMLLKEFSSFV